MQAILIDPELRRVTPIELPHDECELLTAMQAVIGCDAMDHSIIDDVRDSIWVDHGGLNRGEPVFAFRIQGDSNPCAGRAIVIGADRFGRTRAPQISIELLRHAISWLGLIVPSVDWVQEPGGMHAVVTYSRKG